MSKSALPPVGTPIAIAPDGLPAIGPPDAPYGRDKNGNPLGFRPGRRPGAKNKATLALEAKVEAIMAEKSGIVKGPAPLPQVFTPPPPDPAVVAESAFVADEAEIARAVDSPDERKRIHLTEYARAWQLVRAALKAQKALSLKERATLAMDVIKATHAAKEVFVIDKDDAAAVDLMDAVTASQKHIERYMRLAPSAAKGGANGGNGPAEA